jgi:hypothetical protein
MCKCTPTMRTPFCGKGDCVWPHQKKPIGVRDDQSQQPIGNKPTPEELQKFWDNISWGYQ